MPRFKCPECKFINSFHEWDTGVLIVCNNCGYVFNGEPMKEVIL